MTGQGGKRRRVALASLGLLAVLAAGLPVGLLALDKIFPPEGVEIVDHYVFMGLGQVIVLRVPPNRLRMVNIAIEQGAWGAYQTEFYPTYDLAAARIYTERTGL